VDEKHRIVGILTNRDLRFLDDPEILVCDIMTSKSLITTRHPIDIKKARQAMRESRVEKVIVLDDDRRCIGLLTISDIEKSVLHPQACKDDRGRLRVAAASTIGDTGFERSIALIDAGADVIAIDTAHGHSKFVIQAVERLRKYSDEVCIIAGNVATADGVRALADAGADGIKVGIGPGSICTTRIIAGVGIPQITAIMDCAKAAAEYGIPVIADGGVKFSGDIAKAIAAGASCVMVGSILAGTDEAPGEIFLYNGRSCKSYRGMGSIGAMAKGAADRYFQNKNQEHTKFVPEGVEGQVPCKGLVSAIVHQLVGGLRAAMGYTGNKTISEMQKNSNFVRITACGLSESHVHNVQIVREAPNYHYGVKESL
jgi:IMP dehydrogenase